MLKSLNPALPGKSKPWNTNTFLELVFLALILWVAHYYLLHSFGLYEDDYAQISPPLGWHLSDILPFLRWIATWPEGRPLGFPLPYLLAFVGGKLGGLSTIYLFGFLVHTTNAFLFYFLLKRIGLGNVALVGALVFGIFPADTTHIFLLHSLSLHTSLTFLLVASHFYLSGHKTLAHLISLGSLLTYESPYMVFLAIPLLAQRWDGKLIREMIRHFAFWLGILLVVVAIRAVLGEGRIQAVGSSPVHIVLIIGQILASLAIGPAVSLGIFGYGPGWTLLHWNRALTFVFLGCLPFFVWMLSRQKGAFPEDKNNQPSVFHYKIFGHEKRHRISIPYPQTFKLIIAALSMLGLAYGLSFTHFPPTALYGRATSVHLAAAFGGALLFACLCRLFLGCAQSRRLGNTAIVLLSIYLSVLVAYCFSIQLDFKQAWQNEQSFWTKTVAQVPDLSDGTMIFVLDHNLPATRYILTNSWADPIMLAQIFRFPSDWKAPPRLFVVPTDWTKSIAQENDQLRWEVPAATWVAHWEVLPQSNVILLEMENGKLVRRYGSILIDGQSLQLKPLSPDPYPDWKKGVLYPLLIAGAK
jgi:hypothetical protein